MSPVKLSPKGPSQKRATSKITKKTPQKRETKKRFRGKIPPLEEPPKLNEEPELAPEDNKPKREAWLDNLPPVIKPDEELHIELTKKRKIAAHEKHVNICELEAEAILNFALQVIDVKNDKKEIDHNKADFLLGKFLPIFEENKEEKLQKTCSFCSRNKDTMNIQKLLDPRPTIVKDSLSTLYKAIGCEGVFDANSEMNTILERLNNSMKPYTNPVSYPDPVDFPFVVCVTGPPHSGRATISQFIHRFFNTFYITILPPKDEKTSDDVFSIDEEKKTMTIYSFDDKSIISKISEILPKLDEKCGILIRNYPINKAQANALEKSLALFAKHKATDPNINSPIHTINCLFRTSLALEEAQNQITGRLIDIDTGEIFHEKFRPISVLENSAKIQPYPPSDDFASIVFTKQLTVTAQLDILSKKGTIVIPIHFIDTNDKLELQIENVLRQVYEANSLPVPFTSFVHFRDSEQLKFAKFCFDAFTIWYDKCIPIFGTNLSRIFDRSRIILEKIEYLSNCAKEKFLLHLLRPDKRHIMCEEFIKMKPEEREYGHFFKKFWDKSLQIRKLQSNAIETIMSSCGLSKLKGVLSAKESEVFESLIKRFFVVEWFYKSFRILDQNVTEIPPLPELDINPSDFSEIAKKIGIADFLPVIVKTTRPEIVKVEKTKEDIAATSVAFKPPLKPAVPQRKYYFMKPEPEPEIIDSEPEAESEPEPEIEPIIQNNDSSNLENTENKQENTESLDKQKIENQGPTLSVKFEQQQIQQLQQHQNNRNNRNNQKTESKRASSQNNNLELKTIVDANRPVLRPSSSHKKKIGLFLKYVFEQMTVRVLRTDAQININIFEYLMKDVERIETTIDERINQLKTIMKKWIDLKYSHEMEEFAKKFRKLKKNDEFEGEIFETDFNFKEEEEIDVTIKRLVPYLPNVDSFIDIDEAKIQKLYTSIPKDADTMTIDEILGIAKEIDFSEKEQAELEVTIRTWTIPNFINVEEFFKSFRKNL